MYYLVCLLGCLMIMIMRTPHVILTVICTNIRLYVISGSCIVTKLLNMEEIHNTLTTTIDNCICYKEHTVNYKQVRKEPWLTASIKISIDRNKTLYAKMLKEVCSKDKYTCYNKVLLDMPNVSSIKVCVMNISLRLRNCGV